jgi:hypothetical protein
MSISSILEKAELGELPSCKQCPWLPKPKASSKIAFGVSCREHGVDWKKSCYVNSMLIVQDPGNTTPQDTGYLCAVCNSQSRKRKKADMTARHGLDLWKAAVSLDWDSAATGGYMKSHYWTNAIMHGASNKSGLRDNINKARARARKSCTEVLAEQIKALKPKIIIASGKEAYRSLYDIGLIKDRWKEVKCKFSKEAYKEISNWRGLKDIIVFCTYHTAARVVNGLLRRLYAENIEKSIDGKAAQFLPQRNSIDAFLEKYSKKNRGMRYLLNHWLDIGIAIRACSLNKTT